MATQGPTAGGMPQPPPGATGWWQASDGLWYPPQSRPPTWGPAAPPRRNGLATAALVVGIVGVVLGYIGILLGPVAVALGVIGYRNTTEDPTLPGRTMALVGSILGGVAVVTGIASLILFFWVWNWTWSTAGDDFVRSLDETARELESDPFGRSIPDDVQITADCVVTEDNVVRAEGTLTNTGRERRSFDLEVEVHSGSEIHGYTNAEVDDVAPGETVSWETYDSESYAPSTPDPNAGPIPQLECEVDNVNERFATP